MPVLKRMLSALLFILVSIWLCVYGLIFLFQDKFIYFPDSQLIADPAHINLEFETVSLTTADNIALHGWYIPYPHAKQTLLFFHGNAGNISHRLDSIAIFHQLGLSVLIIDYRGYGLSEGKPGEAGTYLDAETAWNYLINERGLTEQNIIIFGRSLGGGIASWLASKNKPGALVLESTFTSISDMAASIYPYLPVRWLNRIHYSSIERIDSINCPILVIHSPDDELVPYRFGQAIYAAASQPKTMFDIRGGHNDGFLLSQPEYSQALMNFIGQKESIQTSK
jgi:uncharacterized protein